MASNYPSRIVCLSAEAVEILYGIGCGERIVGVTGYAVHPPEVRSLPRVSGFSEVNYEKVDSLNPDLVITFSNVQAECSRELIRRGHVVLATNQRSLEDIFHTILLIGRVVGREVEAEKLIGQMRTEIFGDGTVPFPTSAKKPSVYFEEWDDPMISGICWVSELIEAAGGRDIFCEKRKNPCANDRVVTMEEVVRRRPEIIVVSWCGKKAGWMRFVRGKGGKTFRPCAMAMYMRSIPPISSSRGRVCYGVLSNCAELLPQAPVRYRIKQFTPYPPKP